MTTIVQPLRHPDSPVDDEPPDMRYNGERQDSGVVNAELVNKQRQEKVNGIEERETWRGVVVLCGCMMLSCEYPPCPCVTSRCSVTGLWREKYMHQV